MLSWGGPCFPRNNGRRSAPDSPAVLAFALAIDAMGGQGGAMDALTLFGLFAVSFMLVCYMLEARSHWWTLAFAGGCLMGSVYGFLQGAWPFGAVELIWTVVALHRWGSLRRRAEPGA